MKADFLFLGTGGSTGIPLIGCKCSVCHSSSPYNRRLRPSALIKVDGKVFLIDVGPDYREQALKYQIQHLDGLLLTHTHYDHIAGIDELRVYYFLQKKPLDCLLSDASYDELKRRYYYLIDPQKEELSLSARLQFHLFERETGEIDFQGVKWRVVSYEQGGMKVNGYILGNLAYISDIKHYPSDIFKQLKGVDTLILGVVRREPSDMHFTIDEGIAFARTVGAKQTWFTHMCHELEHEETNRSLPADIRLGYDGLHLQFNSKI